MVGLAGLEPATPSLSGTYSNQLSYKPKLKLNYYDEKKKTKIH